jgi:hypothetical protein
MGSEPGLLHAGSDELRGLPTTYKYLGLGEFASPAMRLACASIQMQLVRSLVPQGPRYA